MSLATDVLMLCKLQLVHHGALEAISAPKLCFMYIGEISHGECSWEPSTGN